MAKKEAKQVEAVAALVLRDSIYGKAGEVVELSPSVVDRGVADGALDAHPEAVKAAK